MRSFLFTILVMSVVVTPLFALSDAGVKEVLFRVHNLDDPSAVASFNLLKAKGVFESNGAGGEGLSPDDFKDILFRVDKLADAEVTKAFEYLKGRGVLETTGPPLSYEMQRRIEKVLDLVDKCHGQLDRINPLVNAYNAAQFHLFKRKKIEKQIKLALDNGSSYYDAASSHAKGLKGDHPEIKRTRSRVDEARKEYNRYVRYWNSEWVNDGW